MEIIVDIPPNYEDIIKVFPTVEYMSNVVYTYGGILYNPDNGAVDKPLLVHETTHAIQQSTKGIEQWWNEYLANADFRLSQELEAYINQYKTYCTIVKDRNRQASFLYRIASDLSSPQYGGIISTREAMLKIKNHGN